ncbi:hypothetical protein HMPREF9336_00403 [Segniliparus rugosus ATCC BAA-974]|uniref:Uncharacterized protein n=2 Tax=Segniliparus rugosus TaxID=286804 RepID=E5XLN4_SEGRC|nr:hypothetical protein HMPREF9336_00403 [Segniliparus rugosus ATCC BAA-974]
MDRQLAEMRALITEFGALTDRTLDFTLPVEELTAAITARGAVMDQMTQISREMGIDTELMRIEALGHKLTREADQAE